MGRLAWSQLRFRAPRTIALLAGMLVAATAFTVLTAASRTAQLRTTGTVSAHFRPAYDILVRPKRSRTALETRAGTVQPNFASGIYGGITLAQYHRIQHIPGVGVAAPIAMVGYTLERLAVPVPLPASDYARPGRQLYRYTTTWVSAGGTTRITQPASYLYLTPDRLGQSSAGTADEILPNRSRVTVCPGPAIAANPFGAAAQSNGWCWSKINGTAGLFVVSGLAHQAFATVNWSFPVLIAAIDPAAEAKLDGLNHAVMSGRYLTENAGDGHTAAGQPTFPVLSAVNSGVGEYAVTQVQRLPAPAAPVTLSPSWMAREAAVAGRDVRRTTMSAQQAYRQVLGLGANSGQDQVVRKYWTAGPTRYRRAGNGGPHGDPDAQPAVDMAARPAHRRAARAAGGRAAEPVPGTTGPRVQRRRSAGPGGGRVRSGEDPAVRSAVAGAARAVPAGHGGTGRCGQPDGAARRRPAAEPELGRVREPAGEPDHHAGGAACPGERG